MSVVFQKLTEIEGQIDGEIKTIDKKIKDLRAQRMKLAGIKKALQIQPKTFKKKKVEKIEAVNTQNSKENA